MTESAPYIARRELVLRSLIERRCDAEEGEGIGRLFVCRVPAHLKNWWCGQGLGCWCEPHCVGAEDDRAAAAILAEIEAAETVH